jgi:hypothetical protein
LWRRVLSSSPTARTVTTAIKRRAPEPTTLLGSLRAIFTEFTQRLTLKQRRTLFTHHLRQHADELWRGRGHAATPKSFADSAFPTNKFFCGFRSHQAQNFATDGSRHDRLRARRLELLKLDTCLLFKTAQEANLLR